MEFWVFLQIGLDVILLSIICFYLVRDRKKHISPPLEEISEERLQLLSNSFNQMLEESRRVLDDLCERIDSEKRSLQQVLEKLESKKGEIDTSIKEAERSLTRLGRIIEGNLAEDEINHDKYQRASKLAREGLSADEIAERVKLPKGEVELILDLKKE
ncbi:MAG: DUF2802 domain-containing protein [Pseudomonadota bacterium]